jgi:sodium-dependent dicarboxylate transporter 2/3/5
VSVPGPFDDGPGEPALSRAEQLFEERRRTIGLLLGPLALVVVWLAPAPALTPAAHRLAAIVALVVVWWVTEAIPIAITAVLGPALAIIAGVTTAQQAFAPFASPTVFLFLGSFMLGAAVTLHGLDRRLAVGLLSVRGIGRTPARTRTAVGALTMAISAWMSNTATTAMMLPVALGLARGPGGAVAATGGGGAAGASTASTRRARIALLLAIAYSASIGGMLTPVGSPPNLITIGLLETATGERIDFVRWMLWAAPITAMMAVVMFVLVWWRFRTPAVERPAVERAATEPTGTTPARPTPVAEVDALRDEDGIGAPSGTARHAAPWTRGQRNCAIAFGAAATLWIVPGIVALVAPDSALRRLLVSRLDESVVAVLAAVLLFVLPVDWRARRFTLDWRQASRIDWGTLLLFGGGLSLGALMFETGLAEVIGTGIADALGAESLFAVMALAAVLGVALSELTSNTAATNMVVPVVISLCQARGIDPLTPALAACFGASLGFMLPISTPPNAIVYGTGYIPIGKMFASGVLLDVVGLAVVVTGLWLIAPLLG